MTILESDQLRTLVIDAISRAGGADTAGTIDDTTKVLDLGMDSLLLTEVLLDIEEGLGREVPIELLDRLSDDVADLTLGDLLALFAEASSTAPVTSAAAADHQANRGTVQL